MLHFSVLLGVLFVGSHVLSQEGRKVSWNCYGELGPSQEGQLLHLRGATGPGADKVEVRPRFNQKDVILILTATEPPAADGTGVRRLYTDPSGNRWRYRYANGRASWWMIETSSNLHCTPA